MTLTFIAVLVGALIWSRAVNATLRNRITLLCGECRALRAELTAKGPWRGRQ